MSKSFYQPIFIIISLVIFVSCGPDKYSENTEDMAYKNGELQLSESKEAKKKKKKIIKSEDTADIEKIDDFDVIDNSKKHSSYNPRVGRWYRCKPTKTKRATSRCNNNSCYGSYLFFCKIPSLAQDKELVKEYSKLIFSGIKPNIDETRKTGGVLFEYLTQLARSFIIYKNKDVTEDEIEAWTTANYAKWDVESRFSHYKKEGEQLYLLRGDFGNGHGISQIDDRYHFKYIQKGYVNDLTSSLFYGMNFFYERWEAAKNKKCYKNKPTWTNLSRTAYAGYNSGSYYCRWQRKRISMDKNYYNALKKAPYLVLKRNLTPEEDHYLKCLLGSRALCYE